MIRRRADVVGIFLDCDTLIGLVGNVLTSRPTTGPEDDAA
jgi:hypothetical protein